MEARLTDYPAQFLRVATDGAGNICAAGRTWGTRNDFFTTKLLTAGRG